MYIYAFYLDLWFIWIPFSDSTKKQISKVHRFRRFSEVRNGRQVRLGEIVDMEPAQLQAEAGKRVQKW